MASTHRPTWRILLEVAGIDQVHAPRPGDAAVDHDDLAVQAKIVARDDGRQQANGQRRLHADARLAELAGLPAFPPRPGADRIDQHAAGDAPPAGADQGREDRVGGPALVPDVELHQHALLGPVDVLGDRLEDLFRLRMEAGHASSHGRNADKAGPQVVHAAGLRPMLVPSHMRQALVDHLSCELGIVAAERGDPPGTPQSNAAFPDQQVEDDPGHRQKGDEEHPGQGRPAGRPPHDHPQRDPQHDKDVQQEAQEGKELKEHGDIRLDCSRPDDRSLARAILTRSGSEGNSWCNPRQTSLARRVSMRISHFTSISYAFIAPAARFRHRIV